MAFPALEQATAGATVVGRTKFVELCQRDGPSQGSPTSESHQSDNAVQQVTLEEEGQKDDQVDTTQDRQHDDRGRRCGDSLANSEEEELDPAVTLSDDERIEAAIKRGAAKLRSDTIVRNGQHALFNVRGSKLYAVPWELCSSLERVEAFIRDVYRGDAKTLAAIDQKYYELSCFSDANYKGIVVPDIWDEVVSPGWTIEFQKLDMPEDRTQYDTKVKYTVDFQKKDIHGNILRLFSGTFDQPTHFEVDSDKRGKIPVIEEKKQLTCASTSKPHKPRLGMNEKLKKQSEDKVENTTLYVHSHMLLNVLRSVVRYSILDYDPYYEGEFMYPYKELFCHYNEIESYKTSSEGPRGQHTADYNAICDEHIDVLLHFLNTLPIIRYKDQAALWKRPKPVTTFSALWMLLKPCADVYVQEDDKLNAYVIDDVVDGVTYPMEKGTITKPESYRIRIWNLNYDGRHIYRRSKWINIPHFDGEKEITSLPLYPVEYQDRVDPKIRANLISRGKRYFEYCKRPASLEYTGSGLKQGWKNYKRSRVVVDHSMRPWTLPEFQGLEWSLTRSSVEDDMDDYIRVPQCECEKCEESHSEHEVSKMTMFFEYDEIDPKKKSDLSSHQYLLMASHMFAFVLRDRQFDIVEVDGLNDPLFIVDAITRLVMNESKKSIIKAIAKTYTDTDGGSMFNADFIQGKGEGQVLLLHGPPGTGKTMTAESVAEFTRRPLLNLTAADLGENPWDLERNLLKYFKWANDWDAVVLIDEADVYLESRSNQHLKRNSVVSIFLRALDYFQGILFLTTNRVGRFDEAFMSRIHVSIGYDPLDDDARAKIWDNLFQKLRDDSSKRGGQEIRYDYDAKSYVKKSEDVKKLRWNGREIRNAFQTAVALALNESKEANEKAPKDSERIIPEIKEDHLAQVVELSSAFKKYMTSTHQNRDESQDAYYHGNRDDSVGTPKGHPSESGLLSRRA